MNSYFINCNTLDELKKEYRHLALVFHPDCGGDDNTMKAINLVYEHMFEQLKKAHNDTAAHDFTVHATTETAGEFIDIINALLRLDGLNIELCGCWLWISGNTRQHKETLKASGCQWAAKKQMWSWHHAEDGSKFYRGHKSITDIRAKYGSTMFSRNGIAELAQ